MVKMKSVYRKIQLKRIYKGHSETKTNWPLKCMCYLLMTSLPVNATTTILNNTILFGFVEMKKIVFLLFAQMMD